MTTTELSKGQVIEFWGKRWIFLGANNKEAFFANARKNAKYARYAAIYSDGTINLQGMIRMDVTPERVCEAHGF